MIRFLKISLLVLILLSLNPVNVTNETKPFQVISKAKEKSKKYLCRADLDETFVALQRFAKDKENRVLEKDRLCLILRIVDEKAKKYLIADEIILSMIWQESKFEQDAVSSHGAIGLMQIMPNTARIYVKNLGQLKNPHQNIEIGVRYLDYLIKKYEDLDKALIAYNQGEGNVSRGTYNTKYKDLIYKHYDSLMCY